jgi:hypothetical protein
VRRNKFLLRNRSAGEGVHARSFKFKNSNFKEGVLDWLPKIFAETGRLLG